MFNKELFSKIYNVKCTAEELKAFVCATNKQEYDIDNPFDKYFSADAVIRAIEKYQAGEVNDRYLANWACAYLWIINGGFKVDYESFHTTLKEFLIFVVTDWLDGLAFFDKEVEEYYNLDELKTMYKTFEKFLRDIDKLQAVFAPYDEDNEDYVVVLLRNDVDKYFAHIFGELLFGELEGIKYTVEFAQIGLDDLHCNAKQLRADGYKNLTSSLYNIAELSEYIDGEWD